MSKAKHYSIIVIGFAIGAILAPFLFGSLILVVAMVMEQAQP
jgi:hypothetical protein